MVKKTLKRYEYPLKDSKGNVYYGSYTIKDNVKPKCFKDEKLVQKFEALILEEGEIHFTKEANVLESIGKIGGGLARNG